MTKKELIGKLSLDIVQHTPYVIRKYLYKKTYKYLNRMTTTQLLDMQEVIDNHYKEVHSD